MNSGKIPTNNFNICRDTMLTPETVDQIQALFSKGWGKKRIARELGISRTTVKRYIANKTWQPYKSPTRKKKLVSNSIN